MKCAIKERMFVLNILMEDLLWYLAIVEKILAEGY
jgi:hypothetical protein